jgi:hypothetical protein
MKKLIRLKENIEKRDEYLSSRFEEIKNKSDQGIQLDIAETYFVNNIEKYYGELKDKSQEFYEGLEKPNLFSYAYHVVLTMILFFFTWIFGSFESALFMGVLMQFFLLFDHKFNNVILLSIYFILAPLIYGLLTCSIIIFITKKLYNFDPEISFLLTLVIIIPIVSLILFFRHKKRHNFIKKMRVVLEINGLVYFVFLTTLIISIYFDETKTIPESLEKLRITNPADMQGFLAQLFSIPFLIANGALKLLLEYTAYRGNEKL